MLGDFNVKWKNKIMRVLIIISLLLFTTNVLACDVPVGKYRLIVETEGGGRLELKENNTVVLIFKSYRAGKRNLTKTTIYEGNWSCNKSKLEFYFLFGEISASFEKPDHYPLGIYKNSKAVIFPRSSFVWQQLSYGIFWPVK